MKRSRRLLPILAAILAAILASLACAKASPEEIRHYTLTPTVSPIPSDTVTARPSPTERIDTGTLTPSATPWIASISALQSVNVRAEPGEGSESLGVLYAGARVILTGSCNSGWAEIQFGAGRAWISSRYLSGDTCKEEQ